MTLASRLLIPFAVVLLGIGSIIRNGEIENLQDERAAIVKAYEDGSAVIKLSNGRCTIPAFDSPGDRIRCEVER